MISPVSEPAQPERSKSQTKPAQPRPLVALELLVEEVSIDGMCGVY
jgi:mycofactocin precursor